MAAYTVGYGFIQALTPRLLQGRPAPAGRLTAVVTALPVLICVGFATLAQRGLLPVWGMVGAIGLYSMAFAVASAIHSYLIAAYAQQADVAKNIGLYYSANAVGRLAGVLLSGFYYVNFGIVGCLVGAALFALPAVLCALPLPTPSGSITIKHAVE